MSTETLTIPTLPRRKRAVLRWREFCEQWRHSYLLLTFMLLAARQASGMPIPKLENTRFIGGFHPIDVLLLKDMLELMWVPPFLTILLYGASFLVAKLNTPAAIAVTALSSTAIVVFVLVWALVHISLW